MQDYTAFVYTASCWYHDCEPHTYVVAQTAVKAERAICDAMEASAAYDDEDDEDDDDATTQAWSGAHQTTLGKVLEGLSDLEKAEVLHDLETDGVAYLP